jgi:hypothetical protein
MKRSVFAGMTAATFLMSVVLAAQAPPAPQRPADQQQQPPQTQPRTEPQTQPRTEPQSQPRTESTAAKITVSGCIEKANQPSGAASGDSFVLANARTGSGGPVGTTGAAGAAGASAAGASYRLDAEAAKLTPHVGHQVEIVGTAAPAAARPDAPSARPGEPPARPMASLKVESIKMVSQTCSK